MTKQQILKNLTQAFDLIQKIATEIDGQCAELDDLLLQADRAIYESFFAVEDKLNAA